MNPIWQWELASRSYGNYGNANQWTVNAGLTSLARESAQNSNDARGEPPHADLVYTFIRLTGEARELRGGRWLRETLMPHLRAMGFAAGGAVTAGQIRAGVKAMDNSDALLLLKVSDYGCRGLTGPEFPEDGVDPDEYGNFIRLCRLDLFSGKDKAAGGSFGLGKAVYWRFSRLQTVLFNSCLHRRTQSTAGRRIASSESIKAWSTRLRRQGLSGTRLLRGPGRARRHRSIWADPDHVRRLHLDRADTRSGTTALLMGFYDPDRPSAGWRAAMP